MITKEPPTCIFISASKCDYHKYDNDVMEASWKSGVNEWIRRFFTHFPSFLAWVGCPLNIDVGSSIVCGSIVVNHRQWRGVLSMAANPLLGHAVVPGVEEWYL